MEIDTSLLVAELAKAGIEALRARYNEASRRVVMEFPSSEDASSLLNIIARYVPEREPLYARIFAGGGDTLAWEYFVRPHDVSRDQIKGLDSSGLNWTPSKRFKLIIYVRFPPEDVNIILSLLRDYNHPD